MVKNRNTLNETNYKKFKNKLNETIRRAKANYYINQIDKVKKDSKKIWMIYNEIIGNTKRKNQEIKKILFKNAYFTNEKQIANILNENYNSYGKNVNTTVNNINYNITGNEKNLCFTDNITIEMNDNCSNE